MISNKKTNLIGSLLLVFATLIWGTSFFILGDVIDSSPKYFVILVRFLLSAFIMSLIFIKKLIHVKKSTLLHGAIVGIFLGFAYIVQTAGLYYTTPSRNAFTTASYCIMCPFVAWLLFKNKPKSYNIISAVLTLVGIGFVALSKDNEQGRNVLLGDAITLFGAIFYALQVTFIARFAENKENPDDPLTMVVLQMIFACIPLILITAIFEIPTYGITGLTISKEAIWPVLYLTIFATVIAQSCQTFGLQYTTSNQAAVILSLEAVFGTIFSIIFAGEKLTPMLIIGFVIIFVAIIMSELKIDIFNLIKKK